MKIRYLVLVSICVVLLLSGCTSDEKDVNSGTNNGSSDEVGDNNGTEDVNETGFVVFDYPPVDLEKVEYILPMGAMSGGHVTPVDHQYYISYDSELGNDAAVDIEVYSPGSGTVTSIQHMSVAAGDIPIPVDDFRLVIQHTSTVSSIFIHVDELSDRLAVVDPGLGNYSGVNVKVSAGEVIGWYGGSVDYNVVDEDVILCFVNPVSYENEPWKIHCPDAFDYFNESIRDTMVEKCLRLEDPVGGEICYDVDGRLVGTWFENGTNGYGGVDLERYWAGHLSIVYDSIDPDHVVVSIGTFVDTARQFGVSGNSPDPANVSVETGLVEYELVDFEYYYGGQAWDRESFAEGLTAKNNDAMVSGVVLFQLIEDQKLKVEIFPGETAEEVTGFTDNFKIYVR